MDIIDIIVKGLNNKQEEAVLSKNLATLVLAGAGTGKTKVLTSRIAYLVAMGVDIESILAVTFTNKAAGEMKKRTLNQINEVTDGNYYPSDLSIGTFHGICHKLLRQNAGLAGLKEDFSVIDQNEQKLLLKEVVADKLKIGSEIGDKKERTKKIKSIVTISADLIGDLKDSGKRPKDVDYKSLILDEDYKSLILDEDFNFKKVYETYEEEKDRMGILDFGDLILGVVELLIANPSLNKMYKERYRHILVDEFQDTNDIQAKLIELLYDKNESYLFVVGDDDQSIYEWRGAKIENIMNFDKKHENTLVVKLEQNYRSTDVILDCANNLISKNEKRLGKNLWCEKKSTEKVKVRVRRNAYSEADYIADEIKNKIRSGIKASEFAILYRSNYISRVIESKLNERQIPYTIIGGTGFWSRMEVKDLMAYLALSVNLKNNLAFDRIVNLPSRKLGAKKLEAIKALAEKNNTSRFDALSELVNTKVLKGEAGKNAQEFIELMLDIGSKEYSLVDRMSHLLEESGLITHYEEKDAEESTEDRVQNLNELINAAHMFKNENPELGHDEVAFIDYAVLQSTADKETDGESVQMMTVHAAKGLEFPNVYLMGWEDGVFPSDAALKEDKVEEERRLAYVAITRAKDDLTITSASERFMNSGVSPISRFIHELPAESVDQHREGEQRSNYFSGNNRANSETPKGFSKYKIGKEFVHTVYGTGTILNVLTRGSQTEITVNFKGMIGMKKLFIESK